ncbi:MAG: DNA ligase [Pseudomonadota bacterium]
MARMPGRWLVLGLLLAWRMSVAAEAPAVMLALSWESGTDPAGWWMSEKYDGVRGYWDGARMVSRQGEVIVIPAPLRAALPDFPLDGELWAGRGRFEATLAAVRDQVPGPGWADIRYMVFDAPAVAGPFEARMAAVNAWLQSQPGDRIALVAQTRCSGQSHLDAFLRAVERRGGEGVMLRAPASSYAAGRSTFLRKYKSFDDSEATVVGYNLGKGKYAGVVGSLQVVLPNGVRFAVGSGLSDAERRTPPPVGSVITFKHHGWTAGGKPRFPVYWRVREPVGAVGAAAVN